MKKLLPKIGAHISIAGGVFNAPERAAAFGCETMQIFTRSPQGGPAPTLTPEIVQKFKDEMDKYKLESFVIHAPYYINFASLNNKIRYGSIKVLRDELERGSLLGGKYVMAHLGSHSGMELKDGIAKCISGIQKMLEGYSGTTEFLIEISAGAGSVLGDTFDELGEIVEAVKDSPGFGGICFDTCHAFASGYDFRTEEATKKVLKDFDKCIGLKWLKLTHVNDSKFDLNQKKDRHEHIGDGYLGENGLANILNSDPFMKINWILETEDSKRRQDVEALKKIRKHT